MSKFRVTWVELDSGSANSRRFETADEARGFIKGLRASKNHEKIGLQIQDETARYARAKVSEVFPVAELVNGADVAAAEPAKSRRRQAAL